jgi:hypothetical protein
MGPSVYTPIIRWGFRVAIQLVIYPVFDIPQAELGSCILHSAEQVANRSVWVQRSLLELLNNRSHSQSSAFLRVGVVPQAVTMLGATTIEPLTASHAKRNSRNSTTLVV